MDYKKLWPSLLAALPTLLAPFYGDIIAWVSAHPQATMALGSLATIIANILNPSKSQG